MFLSRVSFENIFLYNKKTLRIFSHLPSKSLFLSEFIDIICKQHQRNAIGRHSNSMKNDNLFSTSLNVKKLICFRFDFL